MSVVDRIIECWPAGDEVLQTDRLGEVCPVAAASTAIASGVLGFALMNDRSELVAWFRTELVQAVDWGGDPHNAKLAATEGDDVRLSPRKSFDLWRETIRGGPSHGTTARSRPRNASPATSARPCCATSATRLTGQGPAAGHAPAPSRRLPGYDVLGLRPVARPRRDRRRLVRRARPSTTTSSP